MKLITITLILGCALLFGPWYLFNQPSQGSIFLSILGFVLISIVGYNAQANMTGLGEPGEAMLQKALRWFRIKVLRQDLPPLSLPDPLAAHKSITPLPPLSPLSKWVQGVGLVLVIAPTLLGWKGGNVWRMAFIAIGSVLIVLARRRLPPEFPSDPPHGQEFLQAVWARVQSLFIGKS
jgi:hypothetical protein